MTAAVSLSSFPQSVGSRWQRRGAFVAPHDQLEEISAASRSPSSWEARHQPRDLFQLEGEVRGCHVADLRRMKELEAEHAKLKRMYADLALENAAIKGPLDGGASQMRHCGG